MRARGWAAPARLGSPRASACTATSSIRGVGETAREVTAGASGSRAGGEGERTPHLGLEAVLKLQRVAQRQLVPVHVALRRVERREGTQLHPVDATRIKRAGRWTHHISAAECGPIPGHHQPWRRDARATSSSGARRRQRWTAGTPGCATARHRTCMTPRACVRSAAAASRWSASGAPSRSCFCTSDCSDRLAASRSATCEQTTRRHAPLAPRPPTSIHPARCKRRTLKRGPQGPHTKTPIARSVQAAQCKRLRHTFASSSALRSRRCRLWLSASRASLSSRVARRICAAMSNTAPRTHHAPRQRFASAFTRSLLPQGNTHVLLEAVLPLEQVLALRLLLPPVQLGHLDGVVQLGQRAPALRRLRRRQSRLEAVHLHTVWARVCRRERRNKPGGR